MSDAFEQQDTQPIDRPGDFRGRILDYYGVEGKAGSSSVSVAVQALITGAWDEEKQEWDDSWEQYQIVAEGLICIIKKDGMVNETGARSLVDIAGWNGQMMAIFNKTWEPKPVAFKVEKDDRQNNRGPEYRIGFINPYDSTPGGKGNMTEDKAKAFDSKYGSQLRALAGNVARNAATAAPAGKPTAPKAPGPRKPRKAPAQAPAAQEGQEGGEPPVEDPDIPF